MIIIIKNVGNARLEDSHLHSISTPQYQKKSM